MWSRKITETCTAVQVSARDNDFQYIYHMAFWLLEKSIDLLTPNK